MSLHTPAANPSVSAASFELTPPERLTPIEPVAARQAVPVAPALTAAVDEQVQRFIEGLLTEDVQSTSFKARLDSAFALGREEVSVASSLMQGHFMRGGAGPVEDSAAFTAIREMREHLDALNPGRQGDLFQPNRLLGMIPYGNKLKTYFRRFQSAGTQLQTSLAQLYRARDDMQRDAVELEAVRGKLWDAMQNLGAAVHFAEALDARLADKVLSLAATDALRAKAIEQEVLFYARQNLQDMLTQQAVCINGYLALDVLKKTAREAMNGCTRVATTGMSALAVAQTVAQATGNQVKVMEMLSGVNTTIESLVAESGRQLNNHVEKSTAFAENPMVGVDKLKEMFDQTFKAMDAMDTFRSKAVEVMGQNNAVIKEQIARADQYIDRSRQRMVRESVTPALAGPVQL